MSRVQEADLCDEFASSLTTFTQQRKKKKILKDEKKCHGAVDESSSEKQFRKSDNITFVV